MFLHETKKALLAELFVLTVPCFCYPVGNQNKPVTWIKSNLRLLVICVTENAEHRSAIGQPVDRSVTTQYYRRNVAGVRISKAAAVGIEHRVEERSEPRRLRVLQGDSIQLSAHLGRTRCPLRECADACLHIGHEQRSGQSFTCHVCDAYAHTRTADAYRV